MLVVRIGPIPLYPSCDVKQAVILQLISSNTHISVKALVCLEAQFIGCTVSQEFSVIFFC